MQQVLLVLPGLRELGQLDLLDLKGLLDQLGLKELEQPALLALQV